MGSNATIDQMKALTADITSEVSRMQQATQRRMMIFGVIGAVLVLYMAWAFHRIATFIEPTNLATVTGDIAIGQIHEAIDNGSNSLRSMAPEVVRDAENTIIRSLPDLRAEIQTSLQRELKDGLKVALEPGDRILVEELHKLPNYKAAVAGILADPEKNAPGVFSALRTQVGKRADVKKEVGEAVAELNKLRDHLRKLKGNVGLTPSERAERRFIQVVVARLDLPGKDAAGAKGKKPVVVPAMAHPKKAKG